MTHTEIIKAMASHPDTAFSKIEIESVVYTFLEHFVTALIAGQPVKIRGLGRFCPVIYPAAYRGNPNPPFRRANTPAERWTVRFKAGGAIKKRLNKARIEKDTAWDT